MYKVFNIIGWNEDLNKLLTRLLIQKPSDFNYFEITDKIEEADFVFVIDRISEKYDKNILNKRSKNSKLVVVQREPDSVNRLDNHLINISDKNFTYGKNNHITFVLWWLDYNYESLKKLKYNDIEKKLEYCCITTNIKILQGHQFRMDWLSQAQKYLDIDFYGRDNLKSSFNNYKGTPESFCKTNGDNKSRDKSIIQSYNKSFSFDNTKQKNFITRVNEDFLMWTLPLYWGCPNIDEIYPKNSYRFIDITKPISNETLEYIKSPVGNDEISAIEEARLLVLDKYNYWFSIADIIKTFMTS